MGVWRMSGGESSKEKRRRFSKATLAFSVVAMVLGAAVLSNAVSAANQYIKVFDNGGIEVWMQVKWAKTIINPPSVHANGNAANATVFFVVSLKVVSKYAQDTRVVLFNAHAYTDETKEKSLANVVFTNVWVKAGEEKALPDKVIRVNNFSPFLSTIYVEARALSVRGRVMYPAYEAQTIDLQSWLSKLGM